MQRPQRVFAIGDLQGCFTPLQMLLDKIQFNPTQDQLWFCGDLINRGPDSLQVLRFIKGLGESAVCVLGNHDLHYLAISAGVTTPRPKDTVDEILSAQDREELENWLLARPLLHIDETLGYAMVHAGIYPGWSWQQTVDNARYAESVLRGPEVNVFFHAMYGNKPARWQDELSGEDKTRFIINCFTRMRYCDKDFQLDLTHKGPPGTQGPGLIPWFQAEDLDCGGYQLVFGHWSTLDTAPPTHIHPLDTGCIWGGTLTARELITGQTIQLPCPQTQKPSPDA